MVYQMVSAPDPVVVSKICEPPWKERVVVVLGTQDSAMPSAPRSPTGMGSPKNVSRNHQLNSQMRNRKAHLICPNDTTCRVEVIGLG